MESGHLSFTVVKRDFEAEVESGMTYARNVVSGGDQR